MLRFLLIFIVVNTYGRSFGLPVGDHDTKVVMISDLLSNLTTRCNNQFVSNQIAIKMKDCAVGMPPLHPIQMQCLMFYDASSLLCDLPTSIFPNLESEFAAKVSEKQNVSVFCLEAAHITVPPTSHNYIITRVFQADARCKKVCADENVLSDDTNRACKYYKWSLGILKSSQSSAPVESAGSPPVKAVEDVKDTVANELKSTIKSEQVESVAKAPEGNTNDAATTKVVASLHADGVVNDFSSVGQTGNQNSIVNPSKTLEPHHSEENIEKPEEIEKHSNAEEKHSNVEEKHSNVEEKHSNVEEKHPNVEEVHSNVESKDHADSEVEQEHNIEIPKQNIGADDEENDDGPGDAVGDDAKEDNIDAEGDDGDDLMVSDLDLKNSQNHKPADTHDVPQITINREVSAKDYLPNMSESFTEDDDHFFPFFLTAVIIVVIVYVLYHNKNKVGKMFFGLIVEGRQPGRRRNSRGHAYRRLDTLEQAMSASAPAPPSKIIY